MDKNRKLLIAILALLVFSVTLTIFKIGITLEREEKPFDRGFRVKTGAGVGIVRIEGPIAFASADGAVFPGPGGAEAVIRRLDEMSRDKNIRAIVVRINSPGGSVSATQEIYRKLMSVRKFDIPLIASMGDVAASGGYYVASACDVIVTNPGTITGSIGVIAVSPNLKDLFEKLGISMNVIKSGKYKDMLSAYRDMPEDERKLIQEIIDSAYRIFLRDVAIGRNLSQNDIEPYADGRVFTGDKAIEYKLADQIGGFEEALNLAREKAGLSPGAPVYDHPKSALEMFLMNISEAIGHQKTLFGPARKISEIYSYPFMIEYRLVR